jgi:hypothetical protein
MKKEKIQQIVSEKIEGFLISLFEVYCLKNTNKTEEECHEYLKQIATKDKQTLIDVLSPIELTSFKTIENNWLASIEELEDFNRFREKINKL